MGPILASYKESTIRQSHGKSALRILVRIDMYVKYTYTYIYIYNNIDNVFTVIHDGSQYEVNMEFLLSYKLAFV